MISLDEMKRLIAEGKWQEWGEAFEHNHKIIVETNSQNAHLIRQLGELDQRIKNLRRWIKYGNVIVDGTAQEPALQIADIIPDETLVEADFEIPEEER